MPCQREAVGAGGGRCRCSASLPAFRGSPGGPGRRWEAMSKTTRKLALASVEISGRARPRTSRSRAVFASRSIQVTEAYRQPIPTNRHSSFGSGASTIPPHSDPSARRSVHSQHLCPPHRHGRHPAGIRPGRRGCPCGQRGADDLDATTGRGRGLADHARSWSTSCQATPAHTLARSAGSSPRPSPRGGVACGGGRVVAHEVDERSTTAVTGPCL